MQLVRGGQTPGITHALITNDKFSTSKPLRSYFTAIQRIQIEFIFGVIFIFSITTQNLAMLTITLF